MAMEPDGAVRQVWIFIGERDQWHGQSLALALLELLRRAGCAGGTVLRGVAGFGAHGRIHTASLVEVGNDLPIVVTFVDRAEKIARLMPQIGEMVGEGMITVTPVEVVKFGARPAGPFPPHLTVADVMARDVVSVRADTAVAEIVSLLIDRALRQVPVVDAQRRVIGIITDGDLLRRGSLMLPLALKQALPLPERAAALVTLHDQPHVAADLMTPLPLTLPASMSLAQAARLLADHDLKRMPVVDTDGRLLGMLSRGDLLGTVAEGLRQRPYEPVALAAQAPRRVADVMISAVPAVLKTTPLIDTLERLLETPQRRVVVVDGQQQVVGIITDGDVLRRAARQVKPSGLRRLAVWFGGGERPSELAVAAEGRSAADVMSSPVISVRADAPIVEAIRLLMAEHVKRMPVVDAEGRLVGLVGRAGLLRALTVNGGE